MSDLSELIARVEKATGPDREIDIRIGALGSIWVGLTDEEIAGLIASIPDEKPWNESGMRGRLERCPHYTASLDAVMGIIYFSPLT